MTRIISVLLVTLMLLPCMASARTIMYVPSGEANDVVVIDLGNDRIIGRIDELENAHGLSADPAEDYLVAGSMQAGEADKSSMAKPSAVSEAQHRAHHADMSGKSSPSFVSIVHIKHGHVMRRVPVRALTHHTAVSPDGRCAVAVHSGAGSMSMEDRQNLMGQRLDIMQQMMEQQSHMMK